MWSTVRKDSNAAAMFGYQAEPRGGAQTVTSDDEELVEGEKRNRGPSPHTN